MNEAGRSAGPARGSFKLELDQVLVLHDEIDLPFGEIRTRLGGGLAGHNGLKSLKRELGARTSTACGSASAGRTPPTRRSSPPTCSASGGSRRRGRGPDQPRGRRGRADRHVTFAPLGKAEVVERGARRCGCAPATRRSSSRRSRATCSASGVFPRAKPPRYASGAIAKDDWPDAGAEWTGSELRTAEATAHVELDPLRISFSDSSGRRFAADDPGAEIDAYTPAAGIEDRIGPPLRLTKAREPGERYFGCGERTGGLEKTASHQVFWNIDPPRGHTAVAQQPVHVDPVRARRCRTARALGPVPRQPAAASSSTCARGRPARWSAPTARRPRLLRLRRTDAARACSSATRELTGRIPLPPLWALGNHQCRWGYMTPTRCAGIARGFRERGIPLRRAVPRHRLHGRLPRLHLGPASASRTRGPDRASWRGDGFRVVTIVDPGVKVDEDYPVYTRGPRPRTCSARRSTARSTATSSGPGCARSPTSPTRARASGGATSTPRCSTQGVAGIWCDMNEPTLFVPDAGDAAATSCTPAAARPRCTPRSTTSTAR